MKRGDDVQGSGGPKVGLWDYIRSAFSLLRSWLWRRKLSVTVIVIVLTAAAVSLAILLRPSSAELSNDEIVIRVNKALSIQGDANPAILTVDKEEEITQPFLDQARNGDKVLLYYKARKAVLFRPSENTVIHQGSYTPPDAKVFVRKGTHEDARVDEVRKQLESVAEIDVVSQDDSAKQDYKGVTLVSVTDRYDDKLRELEQLFGVEAIRLPAGETFPDADILVIVGS